jgi:hypothetical protein
MSDIVERLRQQATIEAKKFGDAAYIQLEWKAADEITHLRARVEVLERIRAAADNLFTYDSGWSHWEKKYRELRAVLKEAKP